MLYAFVCEDVPGTLEKRLATRAVHLARLHELNKAGRLFVAGAFPATDSADPGPAGYTGSLIVAEFANLGEAQAWADAEPFLAAGVYARIIVKPFRKALPA
jgi:uncharacterized protein YciI